MQPARLTASWCACNKALWRLPLSPLGRFLYCPPATVVPVRCSGQSRGNMAVTVRDEPKLYPARDVGMVMDFAAQSHARSVAVLVLVALLHFPPGFFQNPPIGRDEPLFAQASKQMIERGDYVDIRFQDDVRY